MATLEESAVAKILGSSAFQALVGHDVGYDYTGGPWPVVYSEGWVFRGYDQEMSSYRDPQGYGNAALVVMERDPWAGPNQYNTARFPSLYIAIYSDPTRQSVINGSSVSRAVQQQDARDRARRIFAVIDPLFHDAANRDHDWPLGVTVISSVRQTDLAISDVMNGDGKVVGIARYSLSVA